MKQDATVAIVGPIALFCALIGVVMIVGCTDSSETKPLQSGEVARGDSAASRSGARRPRGHTSFYRSAQDAAGEPATIPPVLLTVGHEALCTVGVGDTMPEIELQALGGRRTTLADLYGRKATVVVFWKGDRRMARTELADLGPDVVEPFKSDGVAVVGIAVGESSGRARSAVRQARASFPNLLDTDGTAFALVGSEKLPRTYLLDADGKILWFDIEYSLSTRRELAQALDAVVQ